MFSPDMVRYIIDPEQITDEGEENRTVYVEKQVFRYSLLNYEKVLNDYSFFSNIFSKIGRIFEIFALNFK